MASKLKIIPLGGLGEIGKNLTVYEYGKDMFLVDCGMGFPDQDLYGVDMVIPDISYLKANKNRIRGMVITHGHEDHIGAIPYVLKQLDMPIYATPLTAAIIELKLEEHDLLYHTQIFTKKPGDKFNSAASRSNLSTRTTASPIPLRWRSKRRSAPSSTRATSRSTLRPFRAV